MMIIYVLIMYLVIIKFIKTENQRIELYLKEMFEVDKKEYI